MTKLVYIAVVIAVLVPSLIAGIATIAIAREAHRMYVDEQRHTSDTVYVLTHAFKIRVGRSEIQIYPRVWAAACIFIGVVVWLVGTIVLSFVRQ